MGGIGFLISIIYDSSLIKFFTGLRYGPLDVLMVLISHAGEAFFVFLFITAFIVWKERKQTIALWSTFFVTFAVVSIMKIVIARARPEAIGILPLLAASAYSFPSGHAAVAFCAIPLLGKFPKFKIFWILLAIFIAFSRVYVGVHYVSDVIFGGFLGYSIGLIILFIEKKYKPFKRVQKWL